MIKRLCLAFLLLAAGHVSAEPPDFSFVAEIGEGKQSLRQFELDYRILTKLQRQDYGDLSIVNRQNQPVPFEISRVAPLNRQDRSVRDLRFFRLPGRDASDELLPVGLEQSGSRYGQSDYLIVENPFQQDQLTALELNWRQPAEPFSLNVKLESSDDLHNWRTLSDRATVYELIYADRVLVQNSLVLPQASRAKYFRLTFWPASAFSARIEKINGDFQHQVSLQRENWQTVALTPGENANEWLFDTGGYIPVEKIALAIPETGLFFQGALFSDAGVSEPAPAPSSRHFRRELRRALHRYPNRRTGHGTWHYRGGLTQYRLTTDAGEIESRPVNVAVLKDRYWKLVLDQPATLLPEQRPGVRVVWTPVVVTFLAQGEPPYRLYFGNADAGPAKQGLSKQLGLEPETVNVLDIKPLESARTAEEDITQWLETNWLKILLWLVLFSGVGSMVWMVFRLFRQMNRAKD